MPRPAERPATPTNAALNAALNAAASMIAPPRPGRVRAGIGDASRASPGPDTAAAVHLMKATDTT